MQKVKTGLVGCGVIGQRHCRAVVESDHAELVAVADINYEAARKTAVEHKVGRFFADAESLINCPDVEAVILAMPTKGRADLAICAMHAGKHVLLEKPGAMNTREVKKMRQAARGLVVAFCSARLRFTPAAEAAEEFFKTGALGKVRVVYQRSHVAAPVKPVKMPPAWRLRKDLNGGGIMANWGVYDLDYLLGICGWQLKPLEVLARTWTVPAVYESFVAPGSDAETHYAALITCDDDAVISLERSEYTAARTEYSWQIVGDKGSLNLMMVPHDNVMITFDRADGRNGLRGETVWEGNYDPNIQHLMPADDFARAILNGGRPKTGLSETMIIQQILAAVYESDSRGKAVRIKG